MKPKSQDTIRIMFQNINGLPYSEGVKEQSMRQLLMEREVDYLGLGELNLNWYKVPVNHSLKSRTTGWFDNFKTNYANNTQLPWRGHFQRGGVASFVTGPLVSHICESTKDKRNLGRWCYTRFRGRNDKHLSIITSYRPVPSNDPGSSYIQQTTVLQSVGIQEDPRTQFLLDLGELLTDLSNKGDQIVVLMDANSDVRFGDIREFFQGFNMVEAITQCHGVDGPETMARNNRRVAIDGIFISRNMRLRCKCGYLNYDEGVIGSDHRPIWIDLPVAVALVDELNRTTRFQARRLQCHHPEVKKRFIKNLDIALREIDFNAQVTAMANMENINDIRTHYDLLIQYHTEACKKAELKCRKLKMGAIPYSPQLSQSILLITMWKNVIKRLEGKKHSMRYIKRLSKRTKVNIPINTNIHEAKAFLDAAYKQFNSEVKPKGAELRQAFIQKRIDHADEEGEVKLATHYRRMFDLELNRNMNRRLNCIFHTGQNTINFVIGKGSDGELRTAEKQSDIEDVMLTENKTRFTQASCNIFLSQPWLERIGTIGLGSGGRQITAGHIPLDWEMNEDTRCILQQCKMVEGGDDRSFLQAIENFPISNGWRTTKEKTSTSPFGLHVGHLKAIFTDSTFKETHRYWSLLPLLKGFSPGSFCRATNLFLEKREGVREVGSLRTIVLFDAMFNMNNKVISKLTMDIAEKLKAISPEQFGSRKQKSASLQSLNKRLIFDMIRQSRRNTIIIGNDMKSAYDRIIHSVAALAMRRVGVPEVVIKAMFEPLQRMDHHVRTIYGDSSQWFSAGTSIFHGIGQGNGAGPMIWTLISSVIFEAYRQRWGSGLKFPIFNNKELPNLAGLAFVDDVDLIVMSNPETSKIQLVQEAQTRLDSYERMIKSTGGAINPSKSYAYFMFPNKQINSIMPGAEVDQLALPNIYCKDAEENRLPLPTIPTDRGMKSLGVYLSPDNSNTEQLGKLREISETWAEKIRSNKLSKTEIFYALDTRYFKQVGYTLLATSISEEESTKILAPLWKAALPKLGIVRTFPRSVLYGPIKYQGIQMKSLFTESMTMQLTTLLVQMQSNTTTSSLLNWTMSCTLFETGFPGPMYQVPTDIIRELCSETWYSHLILSMRKFHIVLEDRMTNKTIQRNNDAYLMEMCSNMGFQIKELKSINRCRLYLGITFLSDLVSGCGKFLMQWTWEGTQHIWNCKPLITYSRPPPADWRIWRRALRRIFRCGKGQMIHNEARLGEWKIPRTTENWYCFIHPLQFRCYIRWSDTTWKVYRLNRRFREGNPMYLSRHIQVIDVNEVPIDGYIGSSLIINNRLQINKARQNELIVHQIVESHTPLQDVIIKYQALGAHNFPQILAEDQASCIANDIRNRTAWGVSDGSYSNDIATAATVLVASNQSSESKVTSVSVVSGNPDILSAYRAELWGLYNIVLQVYLIAEAYKIEAGLVTIWCDGQAAVKQCNERHANPNRPNYDILSSLEFLRSQMPAIELVFNYVQGHQDLITDLELTPQAVENINMDKLAQRYRVQLEEASYKSFYFPVPYTNNVISCGQSFMSGNINEWIREKIHGPKIQQHWLKTNRLTQANMGLIQWDLSLAALLNTPARNRIAISKFIAGYSGVGKWIHRWSPSMPSECPFCNEPNETTVHVLKCRSDPVKTKWCEMTNELQTWLSSNEAPEEVQEFLPILLIWWRNYPELPFPVVPIPLQPVLEAQAQVGWLQFFQGLFVSDWLSYVETRYTGSSKYKGRRFLIALIRKFYLMSADIWNFRNAEYHHRNGTMESRAQQQRDQEIENQFAQGNPTRSSAVARLLRGGIARIRKLSAHSKALWISSIQSARISNENQEEVERDHLSRTQSVFRRWLRSYHESSPGEGSR